MKRGFDLHCLMCWKVKVKNKILEDWLKDHKKFKAVPLDYDYINVISDFRARRYMEYYNANGTDYITGMKILPIQTSELKTLLRFDVRYPQIYKMLDKAYYSSESPREWYENNIVRETVFYHEEENTL